MSREDPALRRLRKAHNQDGGGCITTYRRDGEAHVRVFVGRGRWERGEWQSGGIRSLAGEIVAYCRDLGPGWLIASISTPSSVYGDLTGWRRFGEANFVSYEAFIVGVANYDVLAPGLKGQSSSAGRRRGNHP